MIMEKKDNKLLREIALEKKRNFEGNLAFVRLRAAWIKRTSNKEWSKGQKTIIDEVYKQTRRLRLKSAHS